MITKLIIVRVDQSFLWSSRSSGTTAGGMAACERHPWESDWELGSVLCAKKNDEVPSGFRLPAACDQLHLLPNIATSQAKVLLQSCRSNGVAKMPPEPARLVALGKQMNRKSGVKVGKCGSSYRESL